LANQVNLIEHVPLELEAIAGSHVLQQVDDLLTAAVLLLSIGFDQTYREPIQLRAAAIRTE